MPNNQLEQGIKKLKDSLKSNLLSEDNKIILRAQLKSMESQLVLRKYPDKEEF